MILESNEKIEIRLAGLSNSIYQSVILSKYKHMLAITNPISAGSAKYIRHFAGEVMVALKYVYGNNSLHPTF